MNDDATATNESTDQIPSMISSPVNSQRPPTPRSPSNSCASSSSRYAHHNSSPSPDNDKMGGRVEAARLVALLSGEYLLMRAMCTRFPPHKAAALADATARILLFQTSSASAANKGVTSPSSPFATPLKGDRSPAAAYDCSLPAPAPHTSPKDDEQQQQRTLTPAADTPPPDTSSCGPSPVSPSSFPSPPSPPPPPLPTLLKLVSAVELELIGASVLDDARGFMRGNCFASLLLDRLLEGLPTECVRLPVKALLEGLMSVLAPRRSPLPTTPTAATTAAPPMAPPALSVMAQVSKLEIGVLSSLSDDDLRDTFAVGTQQVLDLLIPLLSSLSYKCSTHRWPAQFRGAFRSMVAFVVHTLADKDHDDEGSSSAEARDRAEATLLTTLLLLRFVCPLLTTACRDALSSSSSQAPVAAGSPKLRSQPGASFHSFPPDDVDGATTQQAATFLSKCLQKAASNQPPLAFTAAAFAEPEDSPEWTARLALIEGLCGEANRVWTVQIGRAVSTFFASVLAAEESPSPAQHDAAPFLRFHPHLASIPQCCSVVREVLESECVKVADRMCAASPVGSILHLPRLLHVTRYFSRRATGKHRSGNAESLYGHAVEQAAVTVDPSAPTTTTKLVWERAIDALVSFASPQASSSQGDTSAVPPPPLTGRSTLWEALVRRGARAMVEPVLAPSPHCFVTFCGLNTAGEAVLCISGTLLAAGEECLTAAYISNKERADRDLSAELLSVPHHAAPFQGPVEWDLAAHLALWVDLCATTCNTPMRLLMLPLSAESSSDVPTQQAIGRLAFSYPWIRALFSANRGVIPPAVLSRCRTVTICRQPQSFLAKTGTMLARLRGNSVVASNDAAPQVEERAPGEPTLVYFASTRSALAAELALGVKAVPVWPPPVPLNELGKSQEGLPPPSLDWAAPSPRSLIQLIGSSLPHEAVAVFVYRGAPTPPDLFDVAAHIQRAASEGPATEAVSRTSSSSGKHVPRCTELCSLGGAFFTPTPSEIPLGEAAARARRVATCLNDAEPVPTAAPAALHHVPLPVLAAVALLSGCPFPPTSEGSAGWWAAAAISRLQSLGSNNAAGVDEDLPFDASSAGIQTGPRLDSSAASLYASGAPLSLLGRLYL